MEIKYDNFGSAGPVEVSLRCPACRQIGTFGSIHNHSDVTLHGQSVAAGFRHCPNPRCRLFVYVVRNPNDQTVVFTEPREVIDFDRHPGEGYERA
jgi:hypothetical protein